MRLHGAFYPLKPSARPLAAALNAEAVYDGAYSRVVTTSAYTVLKATTCEPTNSLLKALKNRTAKSELALPAVVYSHGKIAHDDDNFTYTGWTLERLFALDDFDSMRHARAAGRRVLEALKPGYRYRYTSNSLQQFQDVQGQLKELQDTWGHENNTYACLHISLGMSLKTTGVLKETFMYLHNFVRKQKAGLDMLTRGNILANMFGELVLSDPVCQDELGAQEHFGHVEHEQPKPSRAVHYCLAAWRPKSCVGLVLNAEPASTAPLEREELEGRAERMKALGLSPKSMVWGSPEHLDFLGQPVRQESIWSYPQAARRIQSNAYIQIFDR